MSKRIENSVHPMSVARGPRIDIFFGGNQSRMAEDMMLMMHQSLPHLQKDEHILLLNALCVHDDLAAASDKLSKGHKAKILVYSASGRMLREKLEFLSHLVVAKQVRMIVLNSWEFAACGSRQKHALAHWLREMRDGNKVRVVVYSLEKECPRHGALPQLAYTANSTDEMGEWRWHNKYASGEFYPNATETANEYAQAVEAKASAGKSDAATAEAASTEAATSEFTDQPEFVIPRERRGGLEFVKASDILQARSLKNKELEVAGTLEVC
jgi:hypothetical protein